MTDKITELVAEMRRVTGVGDVDSGSMAVYADALEAEHQRNVEGPCHHQNAAYLRLLRERDTLYAALLEMADAARNCPTYKTVDDILSRAIDTKEEGNG